MTRKLASLRLWKIKYDCITLVKGVVCTLEVVGLNPHSKLQFLFIILQLSSQLISCVLFTLNGLYLASLQLLTVYIKFNCKFELVIMTRVPFSYLFMTWTLALQLRYAFYPFQFKILKENAGTRGNKIRGNPVFRSTFLILQKKFPCDGKKLLPCLLVCSQLLQTCNPSFSVTSWWNEM